MAGIALLGVGVIAAFAGLISTTQGDGNGTVAQAPTSSAQVLDPTAEARPAHGTRASPAPDAARHRSVRPGLDRGRQDGRRRPVRPRRRPRCPSSRPSWQRPRPAKAGTRRHRRRGRRRAGSDGRRAAGAFARPLRVYNNSPSRGLPLGPRRTSESAGWTIDEVGGYPGQASREHGLLPAGHGRGGGGEGARPRSSGWSPSRGSPGSRAPSPGVIVIVTKDYAERGKS